METKESFLNWLLKIRNDIYIEQKRPTKTIADNITEIFSIKYLYTNDMHAYLMTIISLIIVILLIVIFYSLKK